MKVRRLSIRRSPGILDGFAFDDVGPGLNVIIGPNGSGKTSAMTALRALLWPDLDAPEGLDASATFSEGSATLIATQQTSGETKWQKDGAQIEPPAIPEGRFACCYFPTLQDVLLPSNDDDALGKEIARQLASGYDVPSLLAGDTWGQPGQPGRTQAKAYKEATKTVSALQRTQADLARAEQDLGDKRRDLKEARAAQQRLPTLERAAKRLEALQQLASRKAVLTTYPDGLDALSGTEREQFDRLAKQEAEAAQQAKDALREAADHDRARQETRLDKPVDAARIKATRAEADAARTDESARDDLARRLASAQARTQDAGRRLGTSGAAAPAELPSMDRVEALLHDADSLQAEQSRLDVEFRVLGAAKEPDDRALREAAAALRAWLATPDAPVTNLGLRVVACVLASLAALSGLALAIGVHPVFALVVLVALALGAVALVLNRQADPRPAAQARYAATGRPGPSTWTRPAVEALLATTDAAIREADDLRVRSGARERLQAQAENLKERASAQRIAVDLLRKELCLDVGGMLAAAAFCEALRQHAQTQTERVGLSAEHAEVEKRLAERLRRIRDFLVPFGYDAEASAAALAGIDDLERREAQRAKSLFQQHQALRQEERQRASTLEAQGAARDLLAKAGVPDRTALVARLDKLAGWKQAVREHDQADVTVRDHERELAKHADLLALGDDALRVATDAARAAAAQADELAKQITTTETQVKIARDGRALEETLERKVSAIDELAAERDTALRRAAGRFMLQSVATRHEAESRPAVLKHAMELFATFTNHAWSLLVDRNGVFRALEQATGEGRSLSELSAGTRGQLLLAVRLAFATQAEHGVRLPFALDEALSVSDPSRFDAVVACLSALVATQDRQVFYLTSQPLDAERWRQRAGAADDSLKLFDLAAIRRLAGAAPVEALRLPEPDPIPPPGDADATAYARLLGVPPLRPLAGAIAQHPWHLLQDDLATLHRLLVLHVDTVGALEALLSSPAVHALGERRIADGLVERSRWLRLFADAFIEGRCRPVERADLVNGGISPKFIDAAVGLAGSLGGDARSLVAAMRAGKMKGLQTKTIDKLEAWLETEGLLDSRSPLDEAQVLGRVIGGASDPVRDGEVLARQVAVWWGSATSGAAPPA